MFRVGGFRVVGAILTTFVVIAGVAAVGYLAYNAGFDSGVLQGADLDPGAVTPYRYGPRPFGPGAWLLACLAPLFLFFLIGGVMRMFFRPWGWGSMHKHGRGADWMRERAQEWHRQFHEGEDAPEEA